MLPDIETTNFGERRFQKCAKIVIPLRDLILGNYVILPESYRSLPHVIYFSLSLFQPASAHPQKLDGTTLFIGRKNTQVTLCKQFGMIFALIILALLYAKFVMPAVLFFASKSASKKWWSKSTQVSSKHIANRFLTYRSVLLHLRLKEESSTQKNTSTPCP